MKEAYELTATPIAREGVQKLLSLGVLASVEIHDNKFKSHQPRAQAKKD